MHRRCFCDSGALVLFRRRFLRLLLQVNIAAATSRLASTRTFSSQQDDTITVVQVFCTLKFFEMLAAREQENLVHGHQAAAAAKPLNQGIKQLPPKTPGNKTAKTLLRLPLNDENGPTAFGGAKKSLAKGSENAIFGGKQGGAAEGKAFVTPMGGYRDRTMSWSNNQTVDSVSVGPRNRAPLGMKTTNAKTKAFQTPAPASIGGDLGRTNQRSVSIQKPKPKVSHPETTKLEDILADKETLGQREIEYMPPKPKGSVPKGQSYTYAERHQIYLISQMIIYT